MMMMSLVDSQARGTWIGQGRWEEVLDLRLVTFVESIFERSEAPASLRFKFVLAYNHSVVGHSSNECAQSRRYRTVILEDLDVSRIS